MRPICVKEGQSEAALEHAREALEIGRRLAKTSRDRYEPDYAMSLNNHANCLGDMGQSEAALEDTRQALEIHRRLARRAPTVTSPN